MLEVSIWYCSFCGPSTNSGILAETEGADIRAGAWLLLGTTSFLFLEETVTAAAPRQEESLKIH